MDEVSDKGTWSEVVCSISTFRTSKAYYFSCPHCKKKVFDEENGQCNNCSKNYEKACPKYILVFLICDNYDSLWVNAYDEAGTQILGIPASDYANLSE